MNSCCKDLGTVASIYLHSAHPQGLTLAAPPGSDCSGEPQGHAAFPGCWRSRFSPEVRVQGGVAGHLNLDGTGVLQANDLCEPGEGVVQPGGWGALQAQALLREAGPAQNRAQGPREAQVRPDQV